MERLFIWTWIVYSSHLIAVTCSTTTSMLHPTTVLDRVTKSTIIPPESTVVLLDRNRSGTQQHGTVIPGHLPSGWDRLCNRNENFVNKVYLKSLSVEEVNNIVQISCQIWSATDSLSFGSLRAWSKGQNGSKVALRVQGHGDQQTGGSLELPWPMKAENLVYLEVRGCNIKGYFSEYNSKDVMDISDELCVLDIKSSVIFFDISKLHKLIKNLKDISSDVECGPLTLEKYVFSNVTFWIDFDENFDLFNENYTDELNYDELADELLNNFEKMGHICNYTRLRYIDESFGENAGWVHFYVQHAKSLYPEALLFNASHLGLMHIPNELRTWRHHHPKLEYLDLSHNKISHIDFKTSHSPMRNIGMIDLRFNAITNLSRADLTLLQTLKTATINLRNNPFDCHCGIVEDIYRFVAEYPDLSTIGMGRYEYLKHLRCATPAHLNGISIQDLSAGDVYCKPPRTETSRTDTSDIPVIAIVVPIILVISAIVVSFAVALIIRSNRSKRLTISKLSTESLVHEAKC